MIWWEKTVEYSFVLSTSRQVGLDFAAPLSGTQERGGDGIFSSDSKLILVEFKRSEKELITERNKFKCYGDAKQKMIGRDSHHFLIYGSESCGQTLKLHARNYFSFHVFSPVISVFGKGVDGETFKEYVCDLIDLKKEDGRSDGKVGPESIASVVGVSSEGVAAISLTEFVRISLPGCYQSLLPTQTMSSGLSPG